MNSEYQINFKIKFHYSILITMWKVQFCEYLRIQLAKPQMICCI